MPWRPTHRAAERIERELDTNEQAQQRSQKQQDGSEICSVELERLLAEGLTLIERRNAFELMRDQAAELYDTHTGSAWRPRAGSMVNRRTLTAAMIDSRDFLAAKRRAATEVMLPSGPKIAFTGGYECNDHADDLGGARWVHAKHPGMVLLHGGSPKGAERIAACWADARTVPQIAFKPDFNRHRNAAPFKRNDQLLAVLPMASWCSPAQASATTSPTRRSNSASHCLISVRRGAARKRRLPALPGCYDPGQKPNVALPGCRTFRSGRALTVGRHLTRGQPLTPSFTDPDTTRTNAGDGYP